MSFEDTLRAIIREELRAALEASGPSGKWEGCLKLSEAAKLVGGVSVSTLEKWGRAGLRIQRKGRVRVVDVAELRAFVAKQESTPSVDPKEWARQALGGTIMPFRRTR